MDFWNCIFITLYLNSTEFLDSQSFSSLTPDCFGLLLEGGVHSEKSKDFSSKIPRSKKEHSENVFIQLQHITLHRVFLCTVIFFPLLHKKISSLNPCFQTYNSMPIFKHTLIRMVSDKHKWITGYKGSLKSSMVWSRVPFVPHFFCRIRFKVQANT